MQWNQSNSQKKYSISFSFVIKNHNMPSMKKQHLLSSLSLKFWQWFEQFWKISLANRFNCAKNHDDPIIPNDGETTLTKANFSKRWLRAVDAANVAIGKIWCFPLMQKRRPWVSINRVMSSKQTMFRTNKLCQINIRILIKTVWVCIRTHFRDVVDNVVS